MTIDQNRLAIKRHFVSGPDESENPHEVLEVVLNSNEGYVIDISGAQHGQLRPVLTSQKYMSEHHVLACTARKGFGYQAGQQARDIAREIKEGKHGVWRANAEMRKRVSAAMDDWEKNEVRSICQLPYGSKQDYEKGKTLLVNKISDALRVFMAEMENGRWFAM